MKLKYIADLIEIFRPSRVVRHLNDKTYNIKETKKEIKEVLIIGDTTAALGIAQLNIQSGHKVTFFNPSIKHHKGVRMKLLENVKAAAQKRRKTPLIASDKKFIDDAMNHLYITSSPNSAFKTADIVIESVIDGTFIQKLRYKRNILKAWSSISPTGSIFAFALPAEKACIIDYFHNKVSVLTSLGKRRRNVIGINFILPVPVVKTCEVDKFYGTSQNTVEQTLPWLTKIEVCPVLVKNFGDIKHNLIKLQSLIRLVEKRSMTISDIDLVTKLGIANHYYGNSKEFGDIKRNLMKLQSLIRLVEKESKPSLVEKGSMTISEIDLVTKLGKAKVYALAILGKLSVRLATLARFFMLSKTNFSRTIMGPFEMADFIGLDKTKLLLDEINMQNEMDGKGKEKDIQLLKYLISEGKLGRKSGEGFYTYSRLTNKKIVVLDKSKETYLKN